MKKALPGISVVTASYSGSLKTLNKCLEIVRSQSYPQTKIEIIIGHGGSKREITPITQKYKAKYVLIPKAKQNAEYNRGVAFSKAKNELALILDHDNFMPTKNFLREYVEPFLKHKELVAVESAYYHYGKALPLLDRYFALFGCLDPLPYYFGKTDRMMWTSRKWNLLGKSREYKNYYLVKFDKNPRKIPTIGTNGCMMRRALVVKNADVRPAHHYPIDVMVDVITKGHNTFAFTKNSLTHLTSSRGLISFLYRRLKFMKQYHFEENKNRRYSVYMKGDYLKLLKFIIYSLTFVKPTYDATRGFLKVPDLAWFVHPFMCLGITIVYVFGILDGQLLKRGD
ncbi:MAG: Glycosyl transferase [Candidatus Woesebacteria bacterium GW2011_GWB1_38_5b]|uniref:Glycosyl transferase n=1 Tax=Candidatus Woesebacteria bacterium GW2011_GWB1_38_5b TaxID=1618569 RepID=A0A0G0KFQ0_9BACT|nr:MAG: Glycosyl transferase [Candidatus Woesebacteria bacterium GW2011_GWB1_38_5b]